MPDCSAFERLRMKVLDFARGRACLDDGPEASQAALTRLVRFYRTENGGVRTPA